MWRWFKVFGRMGCRLHAITMLFYIRDLSIHGFWYQGEPCSQPPRGYWGKAVVDLRSLLSSWRKTLQACIPRFLIGLSVYSVTLSNKFSMSVVKTWKRHVYPNVCHFLGAPLCFPGGSDRQPGWELLKWSLTLISLNGLGYQAGHPSLIFQCFWLSLVLWYPRHQEPNSESPDSWKGRNKTGKIENMKVHVLGKMYCQWNILWIHKN